MSYCPTCSDTGIIHFKGLPVSCGGCGHMSHFGRFMAVSLENSRKYRTGYFPSLSLLNNNKSEMPHSLLEDGRTWGEIWLDSRASFITDEQMQEIKQKCGWVKNTATQLRLI